MSGLSTARTLALTSGLRFVVLGIAMATNILSGRWLGPTGRGDYQVVLSMSTVAMTVCLISMDISLSQLYSEAESRRRRRRLMSTAMSVSAVLGLVGGAVAALAVLVGSLTAGPFTLGFALAAVALTALAALRTMSQRSLFLGGRPVQAAIASGVEAVAVLIGVTALGLAGFLSPESFLVLTAAGAFIAVVLGSAVSLMCSLPERRLLTPLLRRGIAYHPGQVGLVLLVQVEVILLAVFSDPVQVGFYAVAIALTAPLSVFATSVSTTFLRRVFTGSADSAAENALRLARVTLLALLPMALLLAVTVPFLVPLLWGQAFAGAALPVAVAVIGQLGMAAQKPLGQYFVRQGLTRLMNQRVFLTLAVKVALCVALAGPFGAVGAAISAAAGGLVYTTATIHAFARQTDRSPVDVWSAAIPRPRDFSAVLSQRNRA